jgi:hypothetical protein
MPRLCIFCGNSDLTREHALPHWVIETIGGGQLFTVEAQFGHDAPMKKWPAHGRGGHVRVKYLCQGCNNGWMSALETTAMPLLRPLMNDFSITVDRGQQRLLAIWAMKTAMVCECTSRTKAWFYSTADRQHLLTALAPPPGTFVWIGRSQRSDPSFIDAKKLFPPHGSTLDEGFVTTFALARLVIQVVTVRMKPQHQSTRIALHIKSGPWDKGRGLLQIWPAGATIRWPPTVSFSEQGFVDLTTRFTPGRRGA